MNFLIVLFSVTVAVQAIFFIVLIVAFDKDRIQKKSSSVEITHPPVSVLVCAHDEEMNLRELIPMLQAQHYPDFEVLIVNDRSNDGTFDYLRGVNEADPRIRVVNVDHKPEHVNAKKYAITLGIKSAKNDWVLLTDADCRPGSNEWIGNMAVQFVEENAIVLGYSPYTRAPGLLNLFIRFETLLTGILYIGFTALGRPYMGVGRNLAYRKALFLNNKGFNGMLNVTGGDDDLFINKHATSRNTGIVVGAGALMLSKPKTSISEFFHQKVRHLSVGKRYKAGDKFWLGLFSLTHIFCWASFVALIVTEPSYYWIGGLMLLRITLFSATVAIAGERLGDKFASWYVPLLDFLFAIYYISTGPVAVFTKKIRWTT